MKKLVISVSIAMLFLLVLVVFYLVSENCFKTHPREPDMSMSENHKEVSIFIYISRGSLIRARAWLDVRKIIYEKDNGDWVIVSDTLCEWHYPIFGFGEHYVNVKNLAPSQSPPETVEN